MEPTVAQEVRQEQAKREQDRNYVNFLAACLGKLCGSGGRPVLQELATTEKGLEPKGLAGDAAGPPFGPWPTLAENLKRFDKLSSVQQETLIAGLNDPKETACRLLGPGGPCPSRAASKEMRMPWAWTGRSPRSAAEIPI